MIIKSDSFEEIFNILRSQIVTSSWGGRRYPPFAFAKEGVAMLPSVLKSECAAKVNIAIRGTFAQWRKLTYNYCDLLINIEVIEKK